MLKIVNRPLSPHLTIYIPQLSSIFSIWHRITGLLLISILSFVIIIVKFILWVFLDFSIIHVIFYVKNNILWFWNIAFLNISILIFYHLLNGIRHIIWDLGFYLKIEYINVTALYLIFVIAIFFIYLIQKLLSYSLL